ncbi:hypothetical protein OA848_01430 [Rickettsiales bacterium]|nr:hypothetical protein [Rickettsiales bacterium]
MKYETLNEVILALILWITSNTEYIKPEKEISVEFIQQEELSKIACGKPCEIMAYTPKSEKYKIYLINTMDPQNNVCDQGILMHEIIHVLQEQNDFANDYDEQTKKHLREMNALVNHNIFLSQFGKKILYSNGFAAKFKTDGNKKDNLYC